jgi:mono/diheme cytochrome c family protein
MAEGRQLYAYFCASCHGETGKEGYAPALNNPEFLAAATDGFLAATIARGRQNTPMRAFGPGSSGMATLTSAEIRNIVGFIRSWQHATAGAGNAVGAPAGNGTNDKTPNDPR